MAHSKFALLALTVLTVSTPAFATPGAPPAAAPTAAAPAPGSSSDPGKLPMSFCDIFTPTILVSPVSNKPAMDHSLGTREMYSEASPLGDNIGHQSGRTHLTATLVYDFASEGKESCVFIEEANVNIRIDSTVRIPNEYPTDSCEYTQITLHEERHMAATRDFVNQAVPVIKAYLERDMKGLGGTSMHRRRNEEEAKLYLKQVLDRKLAGYARYLNDEYRKLHQDVIDAPEEMKKVYAACPGGWQPVAAEEAEE